MDKEQYLKKQKYRQAKQRFLQMELESKIRELVSLIERYPIGEQTIPSALLYELGPLKQRVDSFITQLKNHTE